MHQLSTYVSVSGILLDQLNMFTIIEESILNDLRNLSFHYTCNIHDDIYDFICNHVMQ